MADVLELRAPLSRSRAFWMILNTVVHFGGQDYVKLEDAAARLGGAGADGSRYLAKRQEIRVRSGGVETSHVPRGGNECAGLSDLFVTQLHGGAAAVSAGT